MDELLETLLTLAELRDYQANPHRAASGTCLEAELHEGRGVVAKLIVQNGTLKIGDALVCGSAYGRVKAMYDTLRRSMTHAEAGPSMPVNVTGLNVAPAAGEHFYVLRRHRQGPRNRREREQEPAAPHLAVGARVTSRSKTCSTAWARKKSKRSTSSCGPTCAARSRRSRRSSPSWSTRK